jgi:hypothetical protein
MCKSTNRRAARNRNKYGQHKLDTVEGSTPSKTKKGKQPVWEEPVVEVPASLARINVRRRKVMGKRETADRRTLDHASAQGEHH